MDASILQNLADLNATCCEKAGKPWVRGKCDSQFMKGYLEQDEAH